MVRIISNFINFIVIFIIVSSVMNIGILFSVLLFLMLSVLTTHKRKGAGSLLYREIIVGAYECIYIYI